MCADGSRLTILKTHPYLIRFFDAASSNLFPDPNELRTILTQALSSLDEPFDLVYDWSSDLEKGFRNGWDQNHSDDFALYSR